MVSPQKPSPQKAAPRFHIPDDIENHYPARHSPIKAATPRQLPAIPSTSRTFNTDSGYYGTTQETTVVDEMDVDIIESPVTAPIPADNAQIQKVPLKTSPSKSNMMDARRATEDSFVSAKESISRKASEEILKSVSQATTVADDDMDIDMDPLQSHETHEQTQAERALAEPHRTTSPELPEVPADEDEIDAMDVDEAESPSDKSSPVKPIARKSSLNFPSLPQREPLAGSSFGGRVSHFGNKSFGVSTNPLGRLTGARMTGAAPSTAMDPASDDQQSRLEAEKSSVINNDAELSKIHNKTSTQRLHDAMNMLSQPRASKSIHTSYDKATYPTLPAVESEVHATRLEDPIITKNALQTTIILSDDEDWIKPISSYVAPPTLFSPKITQSKSSELVDQISNKLAGIESPRQRTKSPSRPVLHKKMPSETVLESPTKAVMAPDTAHQKQISVSNPTPNLGKEDTTTTPYGSPPRSPSGRKILEGQLSASKAKIISVLKSAKGIFASSAGTSAQAKMEALSPTRFKKPAEEPLLSPSAEVRPMPALYPTLAEARAASPVHQEPRRTRSSYEREQRRKDDEQKRAEDALAKAREAEMQRAAAAAEKKMNKVAPPKKATATRPIVPSRTETAMSQSTATESIVEDVPPPPPPKDTKEIRAQESRRIPIPKPKPAPPKTKTPISYVPGSQRVGQAAQPNNDILGKSLHGTLQPPSASKANTSKPHTFSSDLGSSQSSVKSAAAKRAADAAAKKKIEAQRAQRFEESRKREEQRKLDLRKEAQKKTMTVKKPIEAKHVTQSEKREAARPESRSNNLAAAINREKAAQHPPPRGDIGGIRTVNKTTLVPASQRPQPTINPVKPPPKRALPEDTEEYGQQRPTAQRNPPSYQQLDAKRRKTSEEPEVAEYRGSAMAPPVRPSINRKVHITDNSLVDRSTNMPQEPSKFSHAHTPGQQHGVPSMYISTVKAQHHSSHIKPVAHQNEMQKFAQGKIPFATTPGSMQASQASHASQYGSTHKTPIRPIQPSATLTPHYTPGENIDLPEIPTDSEDADSEDEFEVPEWAKSPFLIKALGEQQLVDPLAVFGPIGELRMDEVFTDNKDRVKKLRKRGTSANWNHMDKLTDSERKRDREARERMELDGGWDYTSQRAALTRKSPAAR